MRIAFDTGGTFTDCVYLRHGRIQILKVPSAPQDPAEAIGNSLDQILASGAEVLDIDLVCGTTVGTNALLQRKGGRVAMVTTWGFEDVLEIGRQARPRLYDLLFEKPAPLVPRARRFGLRERLDYRGNVLTAPSRREIDRIARAVVRSKPDSVAVCMLFSYINPAHEKAMAAALSKYGLQVSISYQILPDYREFERTSTTVVNAYLVPVMSDYLSRIGRIARDRSQPKSSRGRARETQGGGRVRVMQSSGGVFSATAAAREPVHTILSGPAGGALGARYVSEIAGFDRIISFDMGGTSTDVSLMESGSCGTLSTTSESVVSGVPVAVPMLDIHTVGAGGGSLARFDLAGALRVGPESAGAEPGPICYGTGTRPTVTDANLLLGRLLGGGLLGGSFALDASRARHYMNLARAPMRTVEEFAQGIVDVANAIMEKAIRVISVERGHDTRDFTLVAFGGAGALHACDLATALEIPRVLVPCFPGALSALGILRADVTKDLFRTVRLDAKNSLRPRGNLKDAFSALEREGRSLMRAEGFSGESIQIDRALEMRYAGQSYDLTVPYAGDIVAAFHRAHERRYGYSNPARSTEIINIRVRCTGRTRKPSLPKLKVGGPSAKQAIVSKSNVIFGGRAYPARVFDRSKLNAGNRIVGPAVVAEYSATTFIPPDWIGRVDRYGNIILERAG